MKIKSLALALILFLESLYLSIILFNIVETQEYLAPSINSMILVVLMLFALFTTAMLSVGGWGKWEQHVYVSAPIALGIAIPIFNVNGSYSALVFLGAVLILSYFLQGSVEVRNQMLKFNPKVIFRSLISGVSLIFSLIAGLYLVLNPSNVQINLGKIAGDFVGNNLETIVETMLPKGILPIPTTAFVQYINVGELVGQVENDVNVAVKQYQQYVEPIMASLIFASIALLAKVASISFSLLAPIILLFARKVKFLHNYAVKVEREEYSFNPLESSTV